MDENKKTIKAFHLIIIGGLLSWNNNILELLGVIEKPDRNVTSWNWGYDISGMLAILGIIIAIIGLVKLFREKKQQKT